VKRPGIDEPIQAVTHMCVEAMLEISLYSYSYLKLAKMLCLSYYCLCLLFNKIGEEGRQVLPGSKDRETGRGWEGRWEVEGEKWPKQYMHI
jgi:hypothetical protein